MQPPHKLCVAMRLTITRCSTSSPAASTLTADGVRCLGMVCRAAAPLELMLAWLPKCSVTFPGLWRRLVDSPAKSVRTKEHRSRHREELFKNRDLSRACRIAARTTRQVRTDGEGSILIDFCSFASGRLSGPTLYSAGRFERLAPHGFDCSTHEWAKRA